jgi:hypothetical protein
MRTPRRLGPPAFRALFEMQLYFRHLGVELGDPAENGGELPASAEGVGITHPQEALGGLVGDGFLMGLLPLGDRLIGHAQKFP